MTRVLDTSNGVAVPAFYFARAAGDQDNSGAGVQTLGGDVVFGADTGKINHKGMDLGALDLVACLNSSVDYGGFSILVVNGTFSTIYLAENVTAVHGSNQLLYPTFAGKSHAIPPAIPHPSDAGMFFVGCGVFSYDCNAYGHSYGAIRLGLKENGGNANMALSYSLSAGRGMQDLDVNTAITANLDKYQSRTKAFYDATIGAGKSHDWMATDTNDGIAIKASCNGGHPCAIVRIYNDHPDYTVVEGDTLGGIAKAFYCDSSVYTHIQRANPGKITDPNVLGVGLKLKLPDLI